MLTLMVVTMNRPDFVERLLGYYANTGYKHVISIGDSSVGENSDRMKQIVARYKNRLNIVFCECPEMGLVDTWKRLIGLLETPYAAFLPDDDCYITESLDHCVKFLESNDQYAGVHGKGICVSLKKGAFYGKITGAQDYDISIAEDKSALKRLVSYMVRCNSPLFSVIRTRIWKKLLDSPKTEFSFAAELLPGGLLVVSGKIAQIDDLYLVRQLHDERYVLPCPLDWIADPLWGGSYNVFINKLATEVSKIDRITIDKASDEIKNAFSIYIRDLFVSFSGSKTGFNRSDSVYLKAKRILGRIINKAINIPKKLLLILFPGKSTDIIALKNAGSVYHNNIVDVINALEGKFKEK